MTMRPITDESLQEWLAIEALNRPTPDQVAAWWRWYYSWPENEPTSRPLATAVADPCVTDPIESREPPAQA